jgi:hypothetical protein
VVIFISDSTIKGATIMSYPNQPNQQPPQGNYPNQPQYPQNPHGQPTEPPQGYPPNPYGQPQYGGYPPPQYGYQPKRNNAPLIIGGIVALIAIIAVVVIFVLASSNGSNELVGSWQGTDSVDNGLVTFNADGTFRWQDEDMWQTGTWSRNGSDLTITVLTSSSSSNSQPPVTAQIVSISGRELILSAGGNTITYIKQ